MSVLFDVIGLYKVYSNYCDTLKVFLIGMTENSTCQFNLHADVHESPFAFIRENVKLLSSAFLSNLHGSWEEQCYEWLKALTVLSALDIPYMAREKIQVRFQLARRGYIDSSKFLRVTDNNIDRPICDTNKNIGTMRLC